VRKLPTSGRSSSSSEVLSTLVIPADDLNTLIKMSRWAENVSFYNESDKVRFQYRNRTFTALVVITIEDARLDGEDFTLDNQAFDALRSLPLECAPHDVVITLHGDMSVVAKLTCGNMQCETSGIRAIGKNILRLRVPTGEAAIFNLYMKGFAKVLEMAGYEDGIKLEVDGKTLRMNVENHHSRTSMTANGVVPDGKYDVKFNPEYLLDELNKVANGVTGGTILIYEGWPIQFDMFINEMPISIFIAPIQKVDNGFE